MFYKENKQKLFSKVYKYKGKKKKKMYVCASIAKLEIQAML